MTEESSTKDIRHSRLIQRIPIFYGWIILGIAIIGLIMSSPGQTYVVSIFIEHFIEDLGLSRSLVSSLYAVGTIGGSLALPFMGRSIDRYGVRTMMVLISVCFGIICVYLGFVQNAIMLGIGFVGLRMLGQGSLYLVSLNAINHWWVRRRGEAIGISGLITSVLAMGLMPGMVDSLIPEFGWRISYMILGGMLLFFMAPLGLIFVRDQPEQYGLHPDGQPLITTDKKQQVFEEEHWTLQEAVRTTVFWLIVVSTASFAMLGTGLMFHMVSIITDHGMSASVAAWLYLPLSISTAIFTLVSGMLVERISIARMMAAALFLQSLALVMAPYLNGYYLAIAYGIVFGASGGISRTIGGVVWAHFFGRRHLGAITGMTTGLGIAASALGPMIFGVARDIAGNYDAVLIVSAMMPIGLGLASPLIRKPDKRS